MTAAWFDRLFGGWRGPVWLAGLVVLLLLVPVAVGATSYLLYLFFTFFIFAVFGHAWNLLAGYCGLLSFGNQAYVGVGGFAMAVLFYYGGLNVWLALVLGAAIAGAFAWLLAIPVSEKLAGRALWKPVGIAVLLWALYEIAIVYNPALDLFGDAYVRRLVILLLIFLGALPLLKLQGAYFAVATWLIAAALGSVFNEWKLVGAGGGMQVKTETSLVELYYAGLLVLVVATYAIWRLLRSRYGLALTAVRDDEEAARTVGIDIRRVKMLVFVLAGTLTGLAAGLYYIDAVIITPPSAFNIFWSAAFVFVVVAGGMGTLAGPIIGAAIYVAVDRILASFLDQGLLVLGAVAILLMLFLPEGVMGVIAYLRHGGRDSRFVSPAAATLRLLFGTGGRRGQGARSGPGLVAAFLVPGSPLPLMRRDNPPWTPLAEGYEKARDALRAAKPDVLLIYSTQWLAVLDQLWQEKPRISGIHVDENWHELGNLRYDIRIDTSLARDCIDACRDEGITARGVNYDAFPIDSGTITACAFLNPHGETPAVIAANNLYTDFEKTRAMAEIAVAQAVAQGKRVAVIAVGGLSGTVFREQIDFAADRIASDGDDAWNRDILHMLEKGDTAGLAEAVPLFAKDARADMGFKHFAWLLGAMGGSFSGAKVLAYGPTYGAGAAVVEFKL